MTAFESKHQGNLPFPGYSDRISMQCKRHSMTKMSCPIPGTDAARRTYCLLIYIKPVIEMWLLLEVYLEERIEKHPDDCAHYSTLVKKSQEEKVIFTGRHPTSERKMTATSPETCTDEGSITDATHAGTPSPLLESPPIPS